MQKSEARKNHRTVGASTTLSRRYAKRPKLNSSATATVKKSPKVRHFTVEVTEQSSEQTSIQQPLQQPAELPIEQPVEQSIEQFDQQLTQQSTQQSVQQPISAPIQIDLPATEHPMQQNANAKIRARKTAPTQTTKKLTAREIKDQAIQKALSSAENFDGRSKRVKPKMHFGFGRIMLALGCSAAAVAAIVYFVNINMPDISLKVAAMQTGINPSYPTYVPRGYSIASISSEDGKITMEFKNSEAGTKFYLVEENSSWDTTALLNNFVKEEYDAGYSTVREQGLTIYIDESNATWVNGGNVFKIVADDGVLTNKQIRSIAVSL